MKAHTFSASRQCDMRSGARSRLPALLSLLIVFTACSCVLRASENLKSTLSADTLPPKPFYTLSPSRTFATGGVEDEPSLDSASNLKAIEVDSSFNCILTHDSIIGNDTKVARWHVDFIKTSYDAYIKIRFVDNANNDTTIEIRQSRLPPLLSYNGTHDHCGFVPFIVRGPDDYASYAWSNGRTTQIDTVIAIGKDTAVSCTLTRDDGEISHTDTLYFKNHWEDSRVGVLVMNAQYCIDTSSLDQVIRFQWYVNGEEIDNSDSVCKSVSWKEDDSINILCTTIFGCQRMGWFIYHYSRPGDTSVVNIQTADVWISPQPVQNELSMHSGGVEDINSISFFDALGRPVLHELHFLTGERDFSVDTSTLPVGCYFVRVETRRQVTTIGFIKASN